MSPPSDISYMNEPVREALPTPSGWLVAPARDFCLFFIRDPKSVMVAPTVFTQLWYCTEEGIPTKLKNTRRLDYEKAVTVFISVLFLLNVDNNFISQLILLFFISINQILSSQ